MRPDSTLQRAFALAAKLTRPDVAVALGLVARVLLLFFADHEVTHWHTLGQTVVDAGPFAVRDVAFAHQPIAPISLSWAALCARTFSFAHPLLFAIAFKVPGVLVDVALLRFLWRKNPRIAALFALFVPAVVGSGFHGDPTTIAAVLCFAAAQLREKNRAVEAGVVVGVACGFAPFAIAFVPALIPSTSARGRWSFLPFLAAACALALPMLAVTSSLGTVFPTSTLVDAGAHAFLPGLHQFFASARDIDQFMNVGAIALQAAAVGVVTHFKRPSSSTEAALYASCAIFLFAPELSLGLLALPFLFAAPSTRATVWLVAASLAAFFFVGGDAIVQVRATFFALTLMLGFACWFVALDTLLPTRLRLPSFSPRFRMIASATMFAVWCVVTVVAVLHHEQWRDEADTWLVARDKTLIDLWHLSRYVGTPVLWHLVQWPFAKLGLAYRWELWVHWPIACAVAALLAFKSPFSTTTRAALVFSYFFLYEHAVVARNYALTNLGLFVACIAFAHRKRFAPLYALGIAVTASSSPFGLFFACAFSLVHALELLGQLRARRAHNAPLDRGALATTALVWLGTLLALVQLFPRPPDPQLADIGASYASFLRSIARGEAAFGAVNTGYVIAAVCVAATLWLVRKSWQAVVVYLVVLALMAALITFAHVGFIRHWAYFVVASVVARWLSLVDRNDPNASEYAEASTHNARGNLTRAALAVLTLQLVAWDVRGVSMVSKEVSMRFTNAEAMARFVVDNHLDKRIIAAHPPTDGESLLPYLPGKKMYYPSLEAYGTSMPWNRKMEDDGHYNWDFVMERMKRAMPAWNDPKNGILWLAGTIPIPEEQARAHGYRLLHAEAQPVCSTNGEKLWLYEPIPVDSDASNAPTPPPAPPSASPSASESASDPK